MNSYRIINSEEQFLAAYHYRSKNGAPDKLPKSYPLLLRKEMEEFGIMGSAWVYYVIYLDVKRLSSAPPLENFLAGVNAEWEDL